MIYLKSSLEKISTHERNNILQAIEKAQKELIKKGQHATIQKILAPHGRSLLKLAKDLGLNILSDIITG